MQKALAPDTTSDDVAIVENAADVAQETDLSHEAAESLWTILMERASNRQSGRVDIVVQLDEWASQDKYGIANGDYTSIDSPEPLLLAGEAQDYSARAYKLNGAFYADRETLSEFTDFDDFWITDVLFKVDETDDGASKKGEMFVPKSAVSAICLVGEDA